LQALWERFGGSADSGGDFAADRKILRSWQSAGNSHHGATYAFFQIRQYAPLWLAKIHQTLILDDSSNPGFECGFAAKRAEVLKCS
jgi:hypothetical protein